MRWLSIGALALWLAGCANVGDTLDGITGVRRQPAPPAEDVQLLNEIKAAATSIQEAWTETKRLEAAGRNHANWAYSDYPDGRIPGGLDQPVTTSWYGDAVPLVQQLARMGRFQFVESGPRPSAPLIIRAEGAHTVGALLRDIGRQMGARALLVVDAGLGRVEIIYGEGE